MFAPWAPYGMEYHGKVNMANSRGVLSHEVRHCLLSLGSLSTGRTEAEGQVPDAYT